MFFSPENFICCHSEVPQISVIHDLNFEHFPQYLPAKVAHATISNGRRTTQILPNALQLSFRIFETGLLL
ncbi:MAG: hypothetical protein R2847_06610 [Bacteroidia bacterium]